MTNFDFLRFFGNNSNTSSKKRAAKQRRGRSCRIEQLEEREMLSADLHAVLWQGDEWSEQYNINQMAVASDNDASDWANEHETFVITKTEPTSLTGSETHVVLSEHDTATHGITLRSTFQTSNSITLVWDLPTGQLAGYALEYRESGSGNWKTWMPAPEVWTTSITITALAANTAYDFQLTVTNADGSTNFSTVNNVRTDFGSSSATPSVKPAVKASSKSATVNSVMLTWKSTIKNAANVAYEINYTTHTVAKTIVVAASQSSVVIEDLMSNTRYRFTVVALNADGSKVNAKGKEAVQTINAKTKKYTAVTAKIGSAKKENTAGKLTIKTPKSPGGKAQTEIAQTNRTDFWKNYQNLRIEVYARADRMTRTDNLVDGTRITVNGSANGIISTDIDFARTTALTLPAIQIEGLNRIHSSDGRYVVVIYALGADGYNESSARTVNVTVSVANEKNFPPPMPLATLATPANVQAVGRTSTTLDIVWTSVPNAAGYTIQWAQTAQDLTNGNFNTGYSATPSYEISGLTASTSYFVRVMATTTASGYSNSLWSTPVEFTTDIAGETFPHFEANVILPTSLNGTDSAILYVEYKNIGTAAMTAPLLTLRPTAQGAEGARMTLDERRWTTGIWTSTVPAGFATTVQIYADGIQSGALLPGETIRVPVYWAGWNTELSLNSQINFGLEIMGVNNTQLIDSASIKISLKPETYTDEAWDIIWERLGPLLGETWGDSSKRSATLPLRLNMADKRST